MSAPKAASVWPYTEVMLVTERISGWQTWARLLVQVPVKSLLLGLLVMAWLPLVTDVFGLRQLAPGYWTCVWLAFLTRCVVISLFGRATPPLATRRRL